MKLTIIGAGPGGYIAAIRAAQLGAEVTLIEKNAMGGTCLNVGCIPTKALLHAADLYYQMKNETKKNGIKAADVHIDFEMMQNRKSAVVKQLVSGVTGLMKAYGIKVVKGAAKFKTADTVAVTVDEETVEIASDKVIIASGSVPSAVPIPGHDLAGVIDSTGALDFEEIPESLCIIGGGVIGIEMAQIYQRLGTKVTIVEMLPDILANLDTDVTAVIKKAMKRAKTEILLETKVERIEKNENGLVVHVSDKEGKNRKIESEKVLLCVGRQPATKALGLDALGIVTEKNRILVDGNYQTNIENIYAIGDCIGGIMLAHVASAEGVSAVEKIMGVESNIDFETIPSCIYTHPELSGVGLTEKQALNQGLDYEVGTFPLAANGKSLIAGETAGLVKMIADKKSGEILGVHMAGPNATELIAEGALAIHKKATVGDLIATIHAHPSVGESLQEAAHAVFGNALNMPPVRK